MFSGSYAPEDVTFLLKRVELAPVDVAQKERLLQAGRHYSEMISPERLPSPEYLRVFHQAVAQEKFRFARDLLYLARHLNEVRPKEIVLVSLARAGTPIGVLLGRALSSLWHRAAPHFSVSIIRERGIDENALRFLLERYPSEALVFIDGWTGKGMIASELRRAVNGFNRRHQTKLDAGLYAVADLCGAATFAATAEDYLIPSSILGATVSGLVSRSILNDTVIGPGDFHGCLYYEEFAAHDLSRWFADDVFAEMVKQQAPARDGPPCVHGGLNRERSENFLADMRRRFGVRNVHFIKPGLGEATRVLLRRVPDRLLVRDPLQAEVAHLLLLARAKNVPVIVDAGLPYAAAALIKELEG